MVKTHSAPDPYADFIGGANQFLGAYYFLAGWKFKIQDLTR